MKYKLLYVDDEGSNLRVFKSAFRRDYDVFVALSAKEGLKVLEEQKIDVILSDQRMPEVTGVEFLQYTVHHYPDAIRMLVTGFADFDAMKNAINQAQIIQYIQKPWNEVELMRVIENTLKIKHLEKENFKQKKELVTTAVQISRTGHIINSTLDILNNLLQKHTDNDFSNDIIEIQNHLRLHIQNQDSWELFKLRFIEVHPDFFVRLKKAHPELSSTELKYCAYFRINLPTSQIALSLNVSYEAIKKSKYRIRKKIGLQRNKSLEEYISNF